MNLPIDFGERADTSLGGVGLAGTIRACRVAPVRAALLEHKVIAMPDQDLAPDAMVRLAEALGPTSVDPYLRGLAAQLCAGGSLRPRGSRALDGDRA